MAHILAFDQINNVFAHVFGVVADPLQCLGNRQGFQRGGDGARIFHHEGDQVTDDQAVFLVHVQISAHHMRRFRQIEAGKCIQRLVQHVQHQGRHMMDFAEARHVDALGFVNHLAHARDLFRLIANPLQIGGGLDHRHHHPQIGGGGLAAGDDVLAHFIDADIEGVDAAVFFFDLVHQLQIAIAHRLDGIGDLLFHQATHLQHA